MLFMLERGHSFVGHPLDFYACVLDNFQIEKPFKRRKQIMQHSVLMLFCWHSTNDVDIRIVGCKYCVVISCLVAVHDRTFVTDR